MYIVKVNILSYIIETHLIDSTLSYQYKATVKLFWWHVLLQHPIQTTYM